MNIIFLDVDGVLNSTKKLIEVYNQTKKSYSGCDYPFDEICLENLKTLVDATNSKLVICSTWRKYEEERKLSKKIKIIPIIELCISLIEVDVIASLERVDGILLGAEDLSKDLEVVRTKEGEEIQYARCRIANACKAYKIDAIDTPFTDTNDKEGLGKDANHSKRLGMNAKSAIHPNQIEVINEVYLPTEKEIIWALRVVKAKEEAFAKGIGVFSLDGKMVDKPVIENAEKVILKAKKYKVI